MEVILAKNDNTRSTTFDIKSAVLDTDVDGNPVLVNDDIGEVKLNDILAEFLGQEIDFKISGALKISQDMFFGEGDDV